MTFWIVDVKGDWDELELIGALCSVEGLCVSGADEAAGAGGAAGAEGAAGAAGGVEFAGNCFCKAVIKVCMVWFSAPGAVSLEGWDDGGATAGEPTPVGDGGAAAATGVAAGGVPEPPRDCCNWVSKGINFEISELKAFNWVDKGPLGGVSAALSTPAGGTAGGADGVGAPEAGGAGGAGGASVFGGLSATIGTTGTGGGATGAAGGGAAATGGTTGAAGILTEPAPGAGAVSAPIKLPARSAND